MHVHQLALAGLVAASSLVVGCGAAQPAPDGVPMNNGVPTGPHSMAPVVVTLSQGQGNAQTGETDVIATIDVNEPVNYPVALTITPPRGAQLTGGVAQESLALDHQGRLARTYRVRGPMTIDDPFRIVVHGAAANGGAGFHAERQFPPRPEMTLPDNNNGPRPPGGRPPAPHP